MATASVEGGFPNVDRSALVRRLLKSNARFVVIVAPAGYGKSRLARELIAGRESRVADCADMTSVSAAVRTFLRALGPFDASFEERLSRYLLSLPPDASAQEHWIDVLDEALGQAGGATTVCIENCELAVDHAEAARVIDRVIRSGSRLFVMCSRVPIVLPALARVPPYERYDVRIDDLRFTPDEICALFASFELEASVMQHTIQLSQGWPIAVLTFHRAAEEGRLAAALRAIGDGSGMSALGDYTLTQALTSLSPESRAVLAAAARLGRTTDADLSAMTPQVELVRTEFATCPFVSRTGGWYEVHPLAVAALSPLRDQADATLRRAADNTSDPLRAAQIYLAAGEQSRVADILDTSLAPFMMDQPKPEVAALVASLDEAVLLRHPPTWNATWMARAFTVSSQRMLFESRAVWRALKPEDSLLVRLGVGTSLVNWLLFNGEPAECTSVLDQLTTMVADESEDSILRTIIVAWRTYEAIRRGAAIEIEPLLRAWNTMFAAIPMTHAMIMYTMPGPIAFLCNNRAEARRAFALGVELAFVAGAETIAAVAITNAAFFAWLAGEDSLFQQMLEMLRKASAPNVAEGTRHFLGCATGPHPSATRVGTELQYMRAYGWLIAAGRETDAGLRRTALLAAVDAATVDGQPWLLAFTWIALGLADPAQRAEAFRRANTHASQVEYRIFRDSIAEATGGRIPDAWPALKRLSNDESPVGRIVVSLTSREVMVGEQKVVLARREAELLLALALHPSPRDRSTLAAMIWPDLEEKDASNAVSVYVTRLRRRLDKLDLLESRPAGYALRYPANVDVFLLEAAIADGRQTQTLEPMLEDLVAKRHERLPQWVLESDWLLPYARRFEDAVQRIRAARAAQAEAALNRELAEHYRRLLAAEELDE